MYVCIVSPTSELTPLQSLQVAYTLGPEITDNPYHVPAIKAQLNRALPKLLPEIHDEMKDAFRDYIPATNGTCIIVLST